MPKTKSRQGTGERGTRSSRIRDLLTQNPDMASGDVVRTLHSQGIEVTHAHVAGVRKSMAKAAGQPAGQTAGKRRKRQLTRATQRRNKGTTIPNAVAGVILGGAIDGLLDAAAHMGVVRQARDKIGGRKEVERMLDALDSMEAAK